MTDKYKPYQSPAVAGIAAAIKEEQRAATTYAEALAYWNTLCDREVRAITVANVCGGMADAEAARKVSLLARISAALQHVVEREVL